MPTAQEAAARVFPRELAFQMLVSRRAQHHDRERLRSFVGELVIDLSPDLVGVTHTDDNRYQRITFVWDTDSDAVNSTKARLTARINGILDLYYPEAQPIEVKEVELGEEFMSAVHITDR